MWKNIKKFFKWIADHTGILWVARKISSGWKWLFGGKASATQENTPQQEGPSDNERQEPAQANDQSKTTTPKTPAPSGPAAEPETPDFVNQSTPLPYEPLKTTTQEPAQPTLDGKSQESVVNKREEGELKFDTALNGIDLSLKQALVVQDYKSHNVNANESFTELLIYIKCGKDEYRVVGYTLGEPTSIFSVPIASIVKKNENGEYLDSNLKNPVNKDVQEMLGLKDDVTTVKVDSISNEPFEGTALGRPKSNDNGPGVVFQNNDKEPQPTTPNQLVNQDNIAGQDSSKIGETQNSPTTDLTTEQPASGSEPVKIDTPDQPKSPAVQSKPQETLVNANEKKDEPNNAASNEEVQSEVSKKELTAEEQAPNLNKNVDYEEGLGSKVSDNEGFKDDIEQPESLEIQEDEVTSANGSAPTDSSSFDIVSSQATTPDELQESDKELVIQSEAKQKAPANDDGPNSLVATPEVQTASNDKTK